MSSTEEVNQGGDVSSPHPSFGGGAGAGGEVQVMPRGTRYYYLHAEQQRAKQREKYNNDPEIIRKREEREAKKTARLVEKESKIQAKEAEKAAKAAQREKVRQEKIAIALKTSQKKSDSPACK
jgi:nicotinamide mononucleotide (NMN) deamidase PncC